MIWSADRGLYVALPEVTVKSILYTVKCSPKYRISPTISQNTLSLFTVRCKGMHLDINMPWVTTIPLGWTDGHDKASSHFSKFCERAWSIGGTFAPLALPQTYAYVHTHYKIVYLCVCVCVRVCVLSGSYVVIILLLYLMWIHFTFSPFSSELPCFFPGPANVHANLTLQNDKFESTGKEQTVT
jgi:hypothetical protein